MQYFLYCQRHLKTPRHPKLTLPQGNEEKLDIFAYTNTENMRPEPFKIRFIPRTTEVKDLILSEAEVARVGLSKYDGDTKINIEAAVSAHRKTH